MMEKKFNVPEKEIKTEKTIRERLTDKDKGQRKDDNHVDTQ